MSDLYNTKRCLTLLVCCLLISVSALAQTRPDWIHKLPKAKNNTYRYAVESAIANSENNARNQAIGGDLERILTFNILQDIVSRKYQTFNSMTLPQRTCRGSQI